MIVNHFPLKMLLVATNHRCFKTNANDGSNLKRLFTRFKYIYCLLECVYNIGWLM